MKTFFAILIGALLLAPIPTQAFECYPIATAKSDVAKWDKNAVWEQLKEGSTYNTLLAQYKKYNRPLPAHVDSILVAYVTGPDGEEYVLWGVASDDKCLVGNYGFRLTKAEFERMLDAHEPNV